jgi:Holliday junction resolvase RusA-like endonuclease
MTAPDRIAFFVECTPPTVTAQQKGVDFKRRRFFTKKIVRVAEDFYATAFRRYIPTEPMDGALRLQVIYVYPWLKSDTKRDREQGLIAMHTAPDWDNISKAFCDAMSKMGFWVNDSRIADGRLRKLRGNTPGIAVHIERITPETLTEEMPKAFSILIRGKV